MQCFYILTNSLNCLGCGNVLPTHITLTTLLIEVVSDSNKLRNGLEFCGKNTEYLQIPLYNSRLILLLGLNFKIIITRYALAIMAFLANIRPFNSLGCF